MPWRHISGSGLKGWKNIKQHEYYDAYCYEANPEVEIQVYLLDYIPLNDMVGYEFRLHNTHPFVPQILDIITPQTPKETFTKVLMEHTPMRLDESSGLPNKPIEVIVAEVFLGFQAIFKQHGPFRVKENMIGFDKKGTAKVWLNFNFAKNHMNPFDVLRANRQSVMIKNIFDVFQPFGYYLETEISTFQEGKKIVLGQITNKSIERMLWTTGWKKRVDLREIRPKSPLASSKKIILPTPSSTVKSKNSTEIKNYYENNQSGSTGFLPLKNKEIEFTRPDNLRASIETREINSQDIPTFIDELNVRQYLGSSHNMVNSKLMFISFLRQNPIEDNVNDIANIFEYALQKDPDLYAFLLQIRGEIETHPSVQFQARVKKIKDLYNGVEPQQTFNPPFKNETPKKISSPPIFYSTEEKMDSKTIDQLFENDSPRFIRVHHTPVKEDDMVQNFDKALQKFVSDKERNRPSQNFGSYKKTSPISMKEDKGSPVAAIDKRTTGISDKWEIEGNHREQSIQERMKIKQKNFAGLKQQAARVLGLGGSF